jgi:hypothetical protein
VGHGRALGEPAIGSNRNCTHGQQLTVERQAQLQPFAAAAVGRRDLEPIQARADAHRRPRETAASYREREPSFVEAVGDLILGIA